MFSSMSKEDMLSCRFLVLCVQLCVVVVRNSKLILSQNTNISENHLCLTFTASENISVACCLGSLFNREFAARNCDFLEAEI